MNDPHYHAHEASRKAANATEAIDKSAMFSNHRPAASYHAFIASHRQNHNEAAEMHQVAANFHDRAASANGISHNRRTMHRKARDLHKKAAELHGALAGSQHSEQQDGHGYHVTSERAEELLATSAVFQGAKR